MSSATKTEPNLATLQDDIATLRRDVAGLLERWRDGASSGAEAAAARVDEGARRMTRGIAGEGQRQIKALEQRIDQRPLTALLIAAGVGFFGGWLLRR